MKNLKNYLKRAIIITMIMSAVGIANLGAMVTNVATANAVKQDYKTFKGVVIDSYTKNPVIFATIYISGTSIGTVSNNDGEFVLKVKNSITSSTIEISHIGYITQKIQISSLKEEGNVIKLENSSISLKEVIVRPFDPYEMLAQMMRKVKDNYATKPNLMKGFYREAIKKRSNYIYISEAIIDIYKGSYASNYDDDMVKVFKGRRSSRVKAADTLMIKLQGGPSVSLLLDIIKNPYILFEEENIYKYDMKFGETKIIDDKLVYVLEFNQKERTTHPLYNGKLYINSESLALLAAEFSLNLEDISEATKMFIKKKPMGLRFEPLSTYYFAKYKEEGGKYYFNYARYELNFSCDWKKRLFKSKYGIMAEVAVTDRESEKAQKFAWKDRVDQREIFADKVSAFTDNNFWGDENYIEPERTIEEALVKYSKWLKKNGKE